MTQARDVFQDRALQKSIRASEEDPQIKISIYKEPEENGRGGQAV